MIVSTTCLAIYNIVIDNRSLHLYLDLDRRNLIYFHQLLLPLTNNCFLRSFFGDQPLRIFHPSLHVASRCVQVFVYQTNDDENIRIRTQRKAQQQFLIRAAICKVDKISRKLLFLKFEKCKLHINYHHFYNA